eukprot:2209640-Karenia_brevis.AAC.1
MDVLAQRISSIQLAKKKGELVGESRGARTTASDGHWYGAGLFAANSSMKGIRAGMQAPMFGSNRGPKYQDLLESKIDASVLDVVLMLEKA